MIRWSAATPERRSDLRATARVLHRFAAICCAIWLAVAVTWSVVNAANSQPQQNVSASVDLGSIGYRVDRLEADVTEIKQREDAARILAAAYGERFAVIETTTNALVKMSWGIGAGVLGLLVDMLFRRTRPKAQ